MIAVNTAEIFPSENAVRIELSNGKNCKILLKDYENLPFWCRAGSLLENTAIDAGKTGLSETNGYFDGDCAGFLMFLSKKYNIYKSAIAKVALTDVPKKQLYQKLYFAVRQRYKDTDAEPETLKALCRLVCDEFEAAGYIDDRRYALGKAKYLKEYKKYGSGRIKEYLYQKGIPSEIINGVLEDEFFSDGAGDFENMRALLEKKYGGTIERGDAQKAAHMLVRSGYKYQDAKKAVAEFTEFTENEDYGDEF